MESLPKRLTPEEKKRKLRERRKRLRRDRLQAAGDSGLLTWAQQWLRAAILRIGKASRPVFDGAIARFSAYPDAGYPDPSFFPWVPEIEAKTEVIQKELEVLLRDASRLPELRVLSPDHSRIADSGKWRAFFLMGYGHRAELGVRLCPETMAALEKVPRLESAFFSVLLPGMHIRRHRGPTKSLVVCHLGLRVPADSEKCVIAVDREKRPWVEGEVLIFDDTHKHEVWNDTDEMRVVLLMHVRRPLRFPGSLVGDFIFNAIRLSPFVKDGRRNVEKWEKTFNLDQAPTDASAAD
ncbi:MAG: aspartyl/asparaginyl beta-hydroxylase domain-containing protein [Myxococcota bacterium]